MLSEENNASKTAGNRKTKPSCETWPIKHTDPRCLTGEAALQIQIGVCMVVWCLSGEVFVCVREEGKHLSSSLLGQKGNTLRNTTVRVWICVLGNGQFTRHWATAKTDVCGDGIISNVIDLVHIFIPVVLIYNNADIQDPLALAIITVFVLFFSGNPLQ